VWLKLEWLFSSDSCPRVFQTDPRVVEATLNYRTVSGFARFRRTLVWLKRRLRTAGQSGTAGFRRTLVWLKRQQRRIELVDGLAFQTDPRVVEAFRQPSQASGLLEFQTDPRVVEANSKSVEAKRSTSVSDGPSCG